MQIHIELQCQYLGSISLVDWVSALKNIHKEFKYTVYKPRQTKWIGVWSSTDHIN